MNKLREKKYNQILELYKGDDPYKYWLQQCYRIDEFVYTINSSSICQIPIELVECELNEFIAISKEAIHDVFNYKPEKTINISIDILRNALQRCYVKYNEEINQVECSECNGTGKVLWKYGTYEREFDCPVCKGSRGIEVKQKQKTLEKEVGDKCYIYILNLFVKAIEIEKVIKTMEILEINQIKVSNDYYKGEIIFNLKNVKIIAIVKKVLSSNDIDINI